MHELTEAQAARIRAFAAEHGRQWKRKLSLMWADGTDATQRDGYLLRQVRNTLGPEWLIKVKLEK